ncbi:hypothetical protein [Polyangium spumosum]|uniref:SEC-C domain-containing protein n=1 Tax=Polyangium spumosum TaxID=889282 RepID=A0A6N7PHW0_9BACT|nr:hypothetical protein [Polyangium spumosum]MRG91673.1 hypothetical protein [Polyangium spumosum]
MSKLHRQSSPWLPGPHIVPEFRVVISDSGRRVRIPLDGPCVCGSTRRLRYCCDYGESPAPLAAAKTTPKLPQTGYSHPKCYALALEDCDRKISREHYFSKGLVRAYALSRSASDTIRVMRPNKPDMELPSEQALQSNILCRRHNSALSVLDASAERLFRAIHEGTKVVPAYNCRVIAGKNLELWILKVLCGSFAADGIKVPVDWLRLLFGYTDLAAPSGLYMQVPVNKTIESAWSVSLGAYQDDRGTSGAEVSLCGVRFILDLRGERRAHRKSDIGSMKLYRPRGIWFDHSGATTFYLWLDWGVAPAAYESVVLDVL